jgi:hypothetical protein
MKALKSGTVSELAALMASALDHGNRSGCARHGGALLAEPEGVAAVLTFVAHLALEHRSLTASSLLVPRLARLLMQRKPWWEQWQVVAGCRECLAILLSGAGRDGSALDTGDPVTYVPRPIRETGQFTPSDHLAIDLSRVREILSRPARKARRARDALVSAAWDACDAAKKAGVGPARAAWRALFDATREALCLRARGADDRHIRDVFSITMHRFTKATPTTRFPALVWCLDLCIGVTAVHPPPGVDAMRGVARRLLQTMDQGGKNRPRELEHLFTLPPPRRPIGGMLTNPACEAG